MVDKIIKRRCAKLVQDSFLYTRAQKETAARYIELAADFLYTRESRKRPKFKGDPLKAFNFFLARQRFLKHYKIKMWNKS